MGWWSDQPARKGVFDVISVSCGLSSKISRKDVFATEACSVTRDVWRRGVLRTAVTSMRSDAPMTTSETSNLQPQLRNCHFPIPQHPNRTRESAHHVHKGTLHLALATFLADVRVPYTSAESATVCSGKPGIERGDNRNCLRFDLVQLGNCHGWAMLGILGTAYCMIGGLS